MERLSLTQHAKAAAGKLKNSKLKRLTTISASLDANRETLSLDNREHAMMLVANLDRQCGQQSTDTDDLANYFGCSTLDVMEYVPALLSLQAKGFIESANGEEENIMKRQYELCEDVFNAIVEGREVKPIPPTASTEFDQFNFCAKASELIHSRSQEKQAMRKALSSHAESSLPDTSPGEGARRPGLGENHTSQAARHQRPGILLRDGKRFHPRR